MHKLFLVCNFSPDDDSMFGYFWNFVTKQPRIFYTLYNKVEIEIQNLHGAISLANNVVVAGCSQGKVFVGVFKSFLVVN